MTSTKVKAKHQRRKRSLKLRKLRRQIEETGNLVRRRELNEKIRRTSRTAPIVD